MAKQSDDEVFRYQKERQPGIKARYIKWRLNQDPPIPLRCDNPECRFHREPLIWNGKELKLILDHKNGVRGDNRLKNLQLLCPNCNSQQPTHGGGNKGRIKSSEGGFAIRGNDGLKHFTLPAEPGRYRLG